jgi:hypothetical protein
MKSKLTMLTLAGALALSATAPSAMAASNQKGAAARAPRSITASKVAAKAATRNYSKTSAVPPHTILSGAKNNSF